MTERQIHINTDFTVTGWMLCVIPHILKDAEDHSDSDHKKLVNNVISKLFHEVPEDKVAVTEDMFWTDYTEFDNNIGSFDTDEFIWKSKDIRDGNIHFWHQNIHFLAPSFVVLLQVESYQRFLELVQQSVLGVT